MDLSYFAGFFDGEGCVRLKRSGNYIYSVVIVVNTNLEVLIDFKEKFGGNIQPRKRKVSYHKKIYAWEIYSKASVPFLEAILPYLIVKREQVIIVLKMERSLRKSGNKGLSKTLPKKEIGRREKVLEKMYLLNQRGSNGPS